MQKFLTIERLALPSCLHKRTPLRVKGNAVKHLITSEPANNPPPHPAFGYLLHLPGGEGTSTKPLKTWQ